MAHRLPDDEVPTQVAHPHRTVARSSIASAIGALPILWPIVERELGPVWATVAVVAAVAGNALVTRILAVPGVEAWLRQVIPPLAADTSNRRDGGRVDLAAPPAPVFCSDDDYVSVDDLAGIAHASQTARTVSGCVIPWNQPGQTSVGTLVFPPASIRLPRDLSRCKLHFKHTGTEGHRPVGYATGYDVRPDGLWMTFNVARTPDGDAALLQVTEGVFNAFSAEVGGIKRGGPTVTDSIMHGVALVDTPAFPDARVEEVHAANHPKGTPMNVREFILALIRAGQTEEAARAAAVRQYSQAEVDAVKSADLTDTPPPAAPAAPPAEPAAEGGEDAQASHTLRGPIVPAGLHPSAPAVAHASAHDAAGTLVKMIQGKSSEVAQAALADITNSGLIDAQTPQWLGELWTGPAKTRKLVPLLNNRDLRSWRIQGFSWTQKPLVAAYAGDKAEIPTNPVSVEPYEAEAVRWAGGHDLDRKFFDFGDTDILESYWRAMHESYAVVTDQAAAAFVIANAPAVPPADAEATDLITAMIAASEAIDDKVGVEPNYYLANPKDKRSLLGVTQQSLPAFLEMFNVDPRAIKWTKSVPQGTLAAGCKPAVSFHELPGSPLRVEAEHLSHGGRDRAMFGYTAMTLDNADGLAKVEFGTP